MDEAAGCDYGVRAVLPDEDTLSFAPVVAWSVHQEIQAELGTLAPLWKKSWRACCPSLKAELAKRVKRNGKSKGCSKPWRKGTAWFGKPRLLVLDDAQWSDQKR
ncbi:MAG: hypothetical protein U0Z26_10220 [Anaerolineales bacterium]